MNKYVLSILCVALAAACGEKEQRGHDAVGQNGFSGPLTFDVGRGEAVAKQFCAACHGIDGNSAISSYPKLAGMNTAYLIKYTTRIQKGERTSGLTHVMRPVVQDLSEQDIIDVSAYYSRQMPKAGEANPRANLDLGRQIYRAGLPEHQIPPCMACHSPNGAGTPAGQTGKDGTAGSPRLAGQHAEYIITQLKAYRLKQRPSGKMQDITERMSDEQIEAVANYIQGLH